MTTENFFKETREQSRVKSEIIEKYFDTWAKIITATQNRNPDLLTSFSHAIDQKGVDISGVTL
jgi:hypothetical protein